MPGEQPLDDSGAWYTIGAVVNIFEGFDLLTLVTMDENENFQKIYHKVIASQAFKLFALCLPQRPRRRVEILFETGIIRSLHFVVDL